MRPCRTFTVLAASWIAVGCSGEGKIVQPPEPTPEPPTINRPPVTIREGLKLAFASLPITGNLDGGFISWTESGVAAFDREGIQRWATSTDQCPECLLSVDESGTIYAPAFHGNRGFISGVLTALNPDGTKKWQTPVAVTRVVIGSDSLIYAAGVPSNQTFSGTALTYAINKRNGAVVWSKTGGATLGYQFLDEARHTLYSLLDGKLIAADLGTRTDKWSITLPAYSPPGAFVSAGAALGADGTVYVTPGPVAVTPDGIVKWQSPVGLGSFSPLIDDSGNIYVISTAVPDITVFTPNGSVLWKYVSKTSGSITFADPVLDTDRNVYVVERYDNLASWAITPIRNGIRGAEIATVDSYHGRAFLLTQEGRIFYNDRSGSRIQFFDSKGLKKTDPWPMMGKNPFRTWR